MNSSIAPLLSAVRQWIGRPFLDLALSLGGEILKLAAGGVEGVANSHINIVVGTRNVGISVDYDIGSSGDRKMDPHKRRGIVIFPKWLPF